MGAGGARPDALGARRVRQHRTGGTGAAGCPVRRRRRRRPRPALRPAGVVHERRVRYRVSVAYRRRLSLHAAPPLPGGNRHGPATRIPRHGQLRRGRRGPAVIGRSRYTAASGGRILRCRCLADRTRTADRAIRRRWRGVHVLPPGQLRAAVSGSGRCGGLPAARSRGRGTVHRPAGGQRPVGYRDGDRRPGRPRGRPRAVRSGLPLYGRRIRRHRGRRRHPHRALQPGVPVGGGGSHQRDGRRLPHLEIEQ